MFCFHFLKAKFGRTLHSAVYDRSFCVLLLLCSVFPKKMLLASCFLVVNSSHRRLWLKNTWSSSHFRYHVSHTYMYHMCKCLKNVSLLVCWYHMPPLLNHPLTFEWDLGFYVLRGTYYTRTLRTPVWYMIPGMHVYDTDDPQPYSTGTRYSAVYCTLYAVWLYVPGMILIPTAPYTVAVYCTR